MIAKLITTAQTREEAINKMKRALDEFIIEELNTTIPFHRQLMDHPDYVAGNYTTKFMEDFEMENDTKKDRVWRSFLFLSEREFFSSQLSCFQ